MHVENHEFDRVAQIQRIVSELFAFREEILEHTQAVEKIAAKVREREHMLRDLGMNVGEFWTPVSRA